MKRSLLFSAFFVTSFAFHACSQVTNPAPIPLAVNPLQAVEDKTKIQVAILLDTSSSMDGLIEQAKSRLWNIINTLTTLKYKGKTPSIEIALYEYGNDGLSSVNNYIRQVAPLTGDLDLISEKLFSLRTNGGSEYCGAVIAEATKNLKWADGVNSMKLIYIAGNEPFNQGSVHYKEAINSALGKNIFVNTIFCGDGLDGINSFWKDGADVGRGKYFNINSNAAVAFIATPYDDQISKFNSKINETYISYGFDGYSKKLNQQKQDNNASSLSSANATERTVSKSKSAYKNESWDLVDKMNADSTIIMKVKKEELPTELQNKTNLELKKLVIEKANERVVIQNEIANLAKKREVYIQNEMKKSSNKDDLGAAINTSIITLANQNGYTVEK